MLPDLVGQKQCEITRFQEDQELEEDAMLVTWGESGSAGRICFPLPCPGFCFYSHVRFVLEADLVKQHYLNLL